MIRARLLVGVGLLAMVGCAGAETSSEATDDDELRSTERGFEYQCTSPSSRTLIDAPSSKILITDGHLRFEGNFGPNLGARDKTYRQPSGTARVRYDGYSTGDDCVLKVVADKALLDGQATGQLRLQCAGDGFQQDILSCTAPRATTLRLPRTPPVTPPPPETPPANAKKWACTTTSEYASLEGAVTMQVVDGSIRIKAGDLEYTGTRDRDYHPRTGNWISYDDLGYGGDCSMTIIVDGNALASATATTTLKVRCAGEGFQEDRYTCR